MGGISNRERSQRINKYPGLRTHVRRTHLFGQWRLDLSITDLSRSGLVIQVERSDSARSCDSLGSVPAAAAGSLLMFVYNGQSLVRMRRRKSCFV